MVEELEFDAKIVSFPSFFLHTRNIFRVIRLNYFVKASVFKVLNILCFLLLLFIICRKSAGIYTPALQNLIPTDIMALACYALLLLISIFAMSQVFTEPRYLRTLLAIGLVATYCFDLLEGRVILQKKGCDMSTCNNLKLFSTGKFVFYSQSQAESRFFKGYFRVSGNTVHLYHTQKVQNVNPEKALNSLGKKGCQFKAMDFACYMY